MLYSVYGCINGNLPLTMHGFYWQFKEADMHDCDGNTSSGFL